ncbi:helix-turn-helix transcriptional regulator [Niallia oryzisoli]|uniref:Helix-turn-helix transcriptional regulator n=1 Tax=Niallia oryzisoli TaxID=1737571 RepID=A0ABZ2CQN8_9BACI
MNARQLKLIRLFSGLTQKEFAQEIGVAENTLAKCEASIIEVSTATKAKVLRKYDLSDPEFIEFTKRMTASEKLPE